VAKRTPKVAKRRPRKPSAERRRAAAAAEPSLAVAAAAPGGSGHCLVVGVGASAGGLEAFRGFLEHIPAPVGMAFVFVQHLDPARKSMLVELLSSYTDLTVVEAEDGAQAAADHVYIIPPDCTLTIEQGRLHLSKPAPSREHRRPIDSFLSSLAIDQGELAVGIILSGGGNDGSEGITAIKEAGGLTIAQASAGEHALSGMPSSAAATGNVDHVLPLAAMSARLTEYRDHLNVVRAAKGPDGTRRDAPAYLTQICALLRTGLGHDFSHYKEKTLVRRVQRRMQVLQIDEVPAYIDYLRAEPAELDLLFQELLISVTQFFRDHVAFEILEHEVISRIADGHGADDDIRVWVPGCATGEEAYSIAILLREAIIKRQVSPRIQIFGTDINDLSIQTARAARFHPSTVATIPPTRLARWFVKDGDEYCPIKEIRELCIFSTHSVIKDPPFSRLDLISCRNLLIYLDTSLQDRLLNVFHYALRPGGFLFVGTSEGVTRHGKLFNVADKRSRIFVRREGAAAPAPELPAVVRVLPQLPPGRGTPPEDGLERNARRTIEKYTPAFVVIDGDYEIMRFGGRIGRYLGPSPGAASLNLFNLLIRPLRPIARAALQRCSVNHAPLVQEGIELEDEGSRHTIDLIVEPIADPSEASMFLIAFRDRHAPSPRRRSRAGKGDAKPGGQGTELEAELAITRARLQATIDELETANEEMKSANEEYQSVNEELQSANEELETSKEEMQSINEELQTVNAELNSKNDVLSRANSDLRNLLDSTEIATVFLGTDLRVSNFTPAMTDLFHLRENDRGRPLTEIVSRIDYVELESDVERVLRTLAPIEKEVSIPQDGSTFIMRLRPYRTVDNVIDGVVITFVDITQRTRHERELARLAAIVESSLDAIIACDPHGTITSWNAGAEGLLGYAAREMIGSSMETVVPEDGRGALPDILERIRQGERIQHFDSEWVAKDRRRVAVSANIHPITIPDGADVGISWIARRKPNS
jgi:two-component system CheB/CheR fusion protein